MMANKDELISQFRNVTGVGYSHARFHLESTAWDLEVALAHYYEEAPGSETDAINMASLSEALDSEAAEQQPVAGPSANRAGHSRIVTASDLQKENEASTSQQGEQAAFVGGSERSGQEILMPPRSRTVPPNLVNNLFQAAKEHGAKEVSACTSPTDEDHRYMAFHGTGHRLGETSEPSEAVAGSHTVPKVKVAVKIWKNGFSVDSGDLRTYNDPTNRDFLDRITKGQVPDELIHKAEGAVIDVEIQDHQRENYVKPRAVLKAFTGAGCMLGSPVPELEETSTSPQPPEAIVDPSKPVTTVQIRLSDGKRIVVKFNRSSTVGDVRNFITTSYPQYATRPFVLMTTFPNQDLTDEKQTLEEAKLCSAVIVQRWL